MEELVPLNQSYCLWHVALLGGEKGGLPVLCGIPACFHSLGSQVGLGGGREGVRWLAQDGLPWGGEGIGVGVLGGACLHGAEAAVMGGWLVVAGVAGSYHCCTLLGPFGILFGPSGGRPFISVEVGLCLRHLMVEVKIF